MPFSCLVQICVYFWKEICLFPVVGVCLVSVEKSKRCLPGAWVPGNKYPILVPWPTLVTLGAGLPLARGHRFTVLQNQVFAVPDKGGKK